MLPAFPNPWTATVAPFTLSPTSFAASRMTYAHPRPVASPRPSLPPRLIGLPVTTPGTE